MSDIATRLASTGQLLVRSGIEIDRILTAIIDDRSPITATLPQQLIFLSRMLWVDPIKQRVLIAFTDYKEANSALLKAPSATFKCNHRGAQFAFTGVKPRLGVFHGQPSIKVDLPDIVLALQRNGPVARGRVPKDPPDLRCQLPIGVVSLEARLVDMSLDGRAFLLGDPAIPLCAESWVRGARITPQGEDPVVVDIEVKRVIPTILPDGERATRIACRIVGAVDNMERVVRRFIVDFR